MLDQFKKKLRWHDIYIVYKSSSLHCIIIIIPELLDSDRLNSLYIT